MALQPRIPPRPLPEDEVWEDTNDFESEAPEVEEDPFFRAEIDRRHKQELEEQRQRRERSSDVDRQRQIARDHDIAHLRDRIQTLQGQITRLRSRSIALHAGPRLSRSRRKILKEIDNEIRETSDLVMAMELELELVSETRINHLGQIRRVILR